LQRSKALIKIKLLFGGKKDEKTIVGVDNDVHDGTLS
jgi:hypothetical protein